MNKAIVVSKLHAIADYYLLGAGTWPADRQNLSAFWEILREYGLDEEVPGRPGWTQSTALGKELNVDLVMAFVGAQDLAEIPMILESNGYVDEDETDALWSMTETKFARLLHRYVLRAYLEFCNRSNLLN